MCCPALNCASAISSLADAAYVQPGRGEDFIFTRACHELAKFDQGEILLRQGNNQRRPYVSLSVFVIIVLAVSAAGYARYQHVQAEIAAQRTVLDRMQRGFEDWRDDALMRLSDFPGVVLRTVGGVVNVACNTIGIVCYLVKAVWDFGTNLHIMIPVSIIYLGVGFFGTLKHAENESGDANRRADCILDIHQRRHRPWQHHRLVRHRRLAVLELG